MTKLIKPALIIAAILLTGANAQAQYTPLPESITLQMQTSAVGGQIVGLSEDGQFYAIVCNAAKDGADLLFEADSGDVVIENYNGADLNLTGAAPVRSRYMSFSTGAAQQVCANPSGNYIFKVETSSDDKKMFGIESFKPDTLAAQEPARGLVQVRTGQVGKKIVAVTSDYRFFAIVCTSGFFQSSADFIYPNSEGKLVVKNHSDSRANVTGAPRQTAAYWPMTASATSKVCNFPSGIYTLNIVDKEQQQAEVDFVSGQSFAAKLRLGGGRGRGF